MPLTWKKEELIRAKDAVAFLESAVGKAELWEGVLVTMPPAGLWHNRIGERFALLFREYCRQHQERGLLYGGDQDGFLIASDPDVLYSPDASLFVASTKGEKGPWIVGAPELVVEVLAPSNSAAEMAAKRQKYFAGGTSQFWLVAPEEETISLYFQDGRILIASTPDSFTGEGIAEGLAVDLRHIFSRNMLD